MPLNVSTDGGAARLLRPLLLLWVAGLAMRVTILAIPPVLPLIHDDLHLTETQVGLLVGLPLLLFALAAVPGSLFVSRLGAGLTMFVGMLFTAAGAAGRGGAANVYLLYAATIVMGFGISIMQPALPALVREWTPHRMAFATALSSNGMLVGVTLAPVLTIPVVLPALGQSWRLDLVFWAVPVVLAAALFALLRPATDRPVQPRASGPQRWWPDWRSPLTWLLGLSFGSNNSIYYGTNGFLPDYLSSIGRQDLIGSALGWLNGSQLLASLVLLVAASHIQRRTWPYPVVGFFTVLALLGILFTDGYWIVFCAGVVGFSTSFTFVMLLALPPALSPPHDVHRTAAGMFTVSYSCAVVIPIISGGLWDLTGIPALAFVPLCLGAITLGTFGAIVSLRDRQDY
jgi:CP family cyanate transporter-like MFS transporter